MKSAKNMFAQMVAAGAVLALATAAFAGDRGRDRHHHHHGSRSGISVRIGLPPVVITRPGPVVVRPPVVVTRPVVVAHADVVPADLTFAAYQSQDRIIIVASGTNSSAGYTTSITALEHGRGTPTLVMCNTPSHYGAAVCTPFSLSAAITSRHAVSCVRSGWPGGSSRSR